MIRRKKVVVITDESDKMPDLAKSIASRLLATVNEQLNVDHLAAIIALKYPQLWNGDKLGELSIPRLTTSRLLNFVSSLTSEDQYILAAEYGNVIIERNHRDSEIRIVSGRCLSLEWVQEIVRVFHKNHGQLLVDVCVNGSVVLVEGRYTKDFAAIIEELEILI